MIAVDQYLRTIKLLLPRHLVSANIGDEEILDELNYERHRFAVVLRQNLPWWASGITRGDAVDTVTRTQAESNVRRWDSGAFTALAWQEIQFPEWLYDVQAVHVFRDGAWYSARLVPFRGAWDIASRTWIAAFPYAPVAATWSDSGSESYHWLGVSGGVVTPDSQNIEVWYMKAPSYLEVGDSDEDMPEWLFGPLVVRVVYKLLSKHMPSFPDNVRMAVHMKVLQDMQVVFYDVLMKMNAMITSRLLYGSSVAYSVKQSHIQQVLL